MSKIFLFTGTHRHSLGEKLGFWMSEFEKKHSSSNLEIINDINEKNLPNIISNIETAPFLSDKRMLIIKDFPFSTEKRNDLDTTSLEQALLDMPDTSLVIFVSPKPDKRGKFYKFLKKYAKIELFELPKKRDLPEWLLKKIRNNGRDIDQKALHLLLLSCGENGDHLSSELDKLFLLNTKHFSEDDIRKYVSPNPEAKIFHALDQIGSGSHVLKSFEKLFQGSDEPLMIFYMLVRQFRLLIQIRSLLDLNLPRHIIQKRMKIAPFQVGMLSKQAERFNISQLKKAYRSLCLIDFRIKTGLLPSSVQYSDLLQLALDRFLCDLA